MSNKSVLLTPALSVDYDPEKPDQDITLWTGHNVGRPDQHWTPCSLPEPDSVKYWWHLRDQALIPLAEAIDQGAQNIGKLSNRTEVEGIAALATKPFQAGWRKELADAQEALRILYAREQAYEAAREAAHLPK